MMREANDLRRWSAWRGFAGAGVHIHLMQCTGIVMILLFLHLFFAPWRRFSHAVERKAFPEAAKELDQIRRIVGINLVLGAHADLPISL